MHTEEALSVQTAIAALARTMHTTSDRHPACEHDVVAEVTTGAADFLSAVDHAGVSLIRRHGKRHTFEAMAPTGNIPQFIDELQELTGDGPCLTAIRDRTTVIVDDYATDARWPELTRKIVENSPVRSSLSMLLYTDQQAIGALNLDAETADAFDDDAVEHAEALAAHAAVGISAVRRDEQFRSALASRDVIGQA
ncbi:GAF domain-containing protein [Rhodococcus sp. Eu-32]|uniref:GAF domain-containing protein n=1 Tax=Rhodococcus sp. Eu-32 TaxID=1017319 RepID=UPI0014029E33|nr:GAF domain-containing protein [Rhodococcus sp. Eu-32]